MGRDTEREAALIIALEGARNLTTLARELCYEDWAIADSLDEAHKLISEAYIQRIRNQ